MSADFRSKLARVNADQAIKPTRARLVTEEKYVWGEKGGHMKLVEAPHTPSEELLLSYVPKTTKYLVSFAGVGIARAGYICTLVGPSGFGKSNITESMVSSFLNPYVDCLGFKVDVLNGRCVLWIDGERTRDDIAIGFDRIKRRVRIEENPDLIDGDRFKNVYCHPFITYPSRDARINELERLITDLQPGLVVLDGAADFVRDVNNTDECVDFVSLLTSWANQYDFGIITSIHPNPGASNDYKPRGVLGSELIRTSESVLLLKRAPDDRDIRILTMDFSHGKNRGQADNLEHYFKWSNESKMFLSCNYSAPERAGKSQTRAVAFNEVLNGKELTYSELTQALEDAGYCKSIPTAKKWIADAVDKQLIFKKNNVYGITPF